MAFEYPLQGGYIKRPKNGFAHIDKGGKLIDLVDTAVRLFPIGSPMRGRGWALQRGVYPGEYADWFSAVFLRAPFRPRYLTLGMYEFQVIFYRCHL